MKLCMCLRQALTSTCISTIHGERDGPCQADVHAEQACVVNSQSYMLNNKRSNLDSQNQHYLQLDLMDLSLPPRGTTALRKFSVTLSKTNTAVYTAWFRSQDCIYSKYNSEVSISTRSRLCEALPHPTCDIHGFLNAPLQ
jgi:hypothetical protein